MKEWLREMCHKRHAHRHAHDIRLHPVAALAAAPFRFALPLDTIKRVLFKRLGVA